MNLYHKKNNTTTLVLENKSEYDCVNSMRERYGCADVIYEDDNYCLYDCAVEGYFILVKR